MSENAVRTQVAIEAGAVEARRVSRATRPRERAHCDMRRSRSAGMNEIARASTIARPPQPSTHRSSRVVSAKCRQPQILPECPRNSIVA